jgi:hypothetical protein
MFTTEHGAMWEDLNLYQHCIGTLCLSIRTDRHPLFWIYAYQKAIWKL